MYRIKQVDIVDQSGIPKYTDVPLSMNLEDIFYTFEINGETTTRSLKDVLFGNFVKEGDSYVMKGYYPIDLNTQSLMTFAREHQEYLKRKIEETHNYWADLPKENYDNESSSGAYIATKYDINSISFYD